MKSGSRIAFAAVGGYLVGRSRKLRRVALLGGILWSGKALASGQSGLLDKTTQALGSTTDLGNFTDVRGRLLEAGKAAAVTSVSNKINSVSDTLHARAESLESDGSDDEEQSTGSQAAEGESPQDGRSINGKKKTKTSKSQNTRSSPAGGRAARSEKNQGASKRSTSRSSGSSERGTKSRKTASGSSQSRAGASSSGSRG